MTQSRKRVHQYYKEQKGLCHWCFLPMRLRGRRMDKLMATVDHLTPPNGQTREFVIAHKLCNNERHYKDDIPNSTLGRIRKTVAAQFSSLIGEWQINLTK